MVAKGVGRQEIRMDMGGMKEYGVGTLSLTILAGGLTNAFVMITHG